MAKIWDLNSKFDYYLQLNLLCAMLVQKLELFQKMFAKQIREKASFTVEKKPTKL